MAGTLWISVVFSNPDDSSVQFYEAQKPSALTLSSVIFSCSFDFCFNTASSFFFSGSKWLWSLY